MRQTGRPTGTALSSGTALSWRAGPTGADLPSMPADPAPLRFRVLGPLTITSGTAAVVLPPSKPTSLLAALLLHPNEVVSVPALQDAIWGDLRPASAKAALQTCTMRLRQLFARHGIAENAIETVPGGYRILATGASVDLVHFRDLVARARVEPDRETELSLLEYALALWHGPLLANVPSEILHRDVIPRIAEERLRAIERTSDLRIGLGRSRSAVGDLWDATHAHPGNERFSAQLVEALYRTGRQAEALAEVRRIRDYLRTELAVAPGPALAGLELAILRGETLAAVAPVPPAASATPRIPALAAPPGFVGRHRAGAALANRLAAGTTITVLSGPPGIGKTALALHAASLAAGAFPGGQILIAARTADGTARAADDLATQAWTVTGDQRALVVLDDAADVEHALAALAALAALPLPDGRISMLLTSRMSLAGVVARRGGWLCRLDVLEPDESVRLLRGVLGAERVDAEPDAARALASICGYLPLALRIAGTRLLTRPAMTLGAAVAWFDEDRIARLALAGDPHMSLAGRFDTSFRALAPTLADAFVRIAAAGTADVSIEAAAALIGVAPDAAETLLDQLADAGLIDEGPLAYRMNDLIQRYARGIAERPALTHAPGPRPPDPKGTRP